MVKIPESTKDSLRYRLAARARERWPAITNVQVRFRAGFAYVDGALPDGEVLKLCRLRYAGYANQWGFAIYRASHDDYEDSFLPTGSMGGSATLSTPPAASTSATPPPGPEPPTN